MFKYLFLFNLQVYLTKYGYLPTSLHHPKDQDGQVKQISEALRVFQKVMELPVSGRLDNATLVMMKQPRCGLKDPFNNRTLKYRVLGHWRKKTLSYRIYNHASSLGVAKTRAAIQTAFRYWSEVSPLRFHELNKGHPDIKISFHGRDRVCPVPFDGPGERRTGLIAFTFLLNFPPFGSGKPVEKPPPAPAVPNKPPADSAAPNPCTASLDAIMLGPLHKTFAFSGDYVWTISDAGYNTPIRINVLWKDLPGHINAAVHSPRTSKSYFLKGEKVWRYSGFKLDHGYPKVLLIPPNIDSAFYSNANKKLIFIKGSEYWQWDELGSSNELRQYPKSLKELVTGLPSNPDAAFTWTNGHTYLFKGDQYWRINPRGFIEKGYPLIMRQSVISVMPFFGTLRLTLVFYGGN
uniref:Peptidase metallopeptidase domain-containing protein n=1 Tax=Astyanax mexicanus TaxID=7994 RepID=A0A8B9H2K4_ASTMX